MKVGFALAVAFCGSVLVDIIDAYAKSANGYCECTSACKPDPDDNRPWCLVSSSCNMNTGKTTSGGKWSYCNYPEKLVPDCTECSFSTTGTRSGQSVNWCCRDSNDLCTRESLQISNNYAYCLNSLPSFSYKSGSSPTPTLSPTPSPTPSSSDTPSPTTTRGGSGTCLNSLYSAACEAIRDGYSAATLGFCQINEQCSSITCSTPTILGYGKKSFSLAYDACKNDFSMTVDGMTAVWDLDKAADVGLGFSVKAVDKKTDTSCSSYDVISFSLAVSVSALGQVTSIPVQFPVGPTSCGMPKWQLYAIIGGCAAAVLVVATICYRMCRKKNNANMGTGNAKVVCQEAVTIHAQPVALTTVAQPD